LIKKFRNLDVQEMSGRRVFLTNVYDLLIGSGRIEIGKANNIVLSCISGSVSIHDRSSARYSLNSGEAISLGGPDRFSIIETSKTSSVLRINSNKKRSKVLQIVRNRIYNKNNFLLSYHQFWSNSVFTADHVREMWECDSAVVYPPVLEQLRSDATKNPYQIVSIGRFMSPKQGHCKNQHQLIQAFEALCRTSDKPWVLHLCGGVDAKNDSYFREVEKKSKNSQLNIHLHPNIGKDALVVLMASSSYFWHATGLGVSSNEPHKLEHFGITVVEAMKGGMIPIVHNSAGPAEILKEFPDLKFRTISELAQITQYFSTLSSELLELERHRLLEASKNFSVQKFKNDVLSHIEELR
jgi:glycosyltransferase involved in cell wall biosynthesis